MIAEFLANLSFALLYLATNPGACAAAVLLQVSCVLVGLGALWPVWRGVQRANELKRRLLAMQLPGVGVPAVAMARADGSLQPQVIVVTEGPGPLAVVGLRSPIIAVEERLLQTLTHDEFQCALAHEVAHVRRADPLRMLLLPPAFAVIAAILVACGTILFSVRDDAVPMALGTGVLGSLLAIVLAVAVAPLARSLISRCAELSCDRAAAVHGRHATASALVKTARLTLSRASVPGTASLADGLVAIRVRALLNPTTGSRSALAYVTALLLVTAGAVDVLASPFPSCEACERLNKLANAYAARAI
jgi:Zn-dependent protease with chaperone function